MDVNDTTDPTDPIGSWLSKYFQNLQSAGTPAASDATAVRSRVPVAPAPTNTVGSASPAPSAPVVGGKLGMLYGAGEDVTNFLKLLRSYHSPSDLAGYAGKATGLSDIKQGLEQSNAGLLAAGALPLALGMEGEPAEAAMPGEGDRFAVLTGENPDGMPAPAKINAARNKALAQRLADAGHTFHQVKGVDVNPKSGQTLFENSFLVPNMDPAEAKALADEFGQTGVLTHEGYHDIANGVKYPAQSIAQHVGDDVHPHTDIPGVGRFAVNTGDAVPDYPQLPGEPALSKNANPAVLKIVQQMQTGARLPRVTAIDADKAAQMAKVYESLPKNDPAAKSSYDALNSEVAQQYKALQDAGYTFDFTKEDPYKSSKEMMADVRDNKHLSVFATPDDSFHPYMTPEQNNQFRAVHDLLAHAGPGNQFGPVGEENAYRLHASTLSPEAQQALATETRGQNSWVNFGPNASLPAAERPFAEQKAALFPKEFLGDYSDMPQETIGQAAMRSADGRIFTAPTHGEAWNNMLRAGAPVPDQTAGDMDGFVTSSGRFVSRDEAEQIADKAGQIKAGAVAARGPKTNQSLSTHELQDPTTQGLLSNLAETGFATGISPSESVQLPVSGAGRGGSTAASMRIAMNDLGPEEMGRRIQAEIARRGGAKTPETEMAAAEQVARDYASNPKGTVVQPTTPPQKDLPRFIPPRVPQSKLDDVEAEAYKTYTDPRFVEQLRNGQFADWYNTVGTEGKAIDALGDEEGPVSFRDLMSNMGAVTARSNPDNNLRRASYYYGLDKAGLLDPEALRNGVYKAAPPGMGHLAQGTHHLTLADKIENGALNPITNPKPASFVENLTRNGRPFTNDTRMATGAAMINPKLLDLGAIVKSIGRDGGVTYSPRNWAYGPMERAFQAASQLHAGRGLLDMVPNDIDPTMYAQAKVWDALGGPGSNGMTFDQLFDKKVAHAAKLWGVTPDQANRLIWAGHPFDLPLNANLIPRGLLK